MKVEPIDYALEVFGEVFVSSKEKVYIKSFYGWESYSNSGADRMYNIYSSILTCSSIWDFGWYRSSVMGGYLSRIWCLIKCLWNEI